MFLALAGEADKGFPEKRHINILRALQHSIKVIFLPERDAKVSGVHLWFLVDVVGREMTDHLVTKEIQGYAVGRTSGETTLE